MSLNNEHQQLYDLLHVIKADLHSYVTNDELIKDLINEELKDIHTALSKWNDGDYGKCERTGEAIPKEWLETIPTLKTSDEWNQLWAFGKITIPYS
ncbi:TraR/DksA family transcriptional regulator [Heyndrickxia sp. NPDC080065]|uniref:TraR/DksA family transcriptional regulator n=1 Tax=Heyndrickxia sp. NPDC080065 TaxID=3390568 RepID=UPI003CFD91AF